MTVVTEGAENRKILGDVTAGELAAFVFVAAHKCPLCGSEGYADTDCNICSAAQDITWRNLNFDEVATHQRTNDAS
jgi:hypothetical protein